MTPNKDRQIGWLTKQKKRQTQQKKYQVIEDN